MGSKREPTLKEIEAELVKYASGEKAPTKEEDLYVPIQRELLRKFAAGGAQCHIEITAKGSISNRLKRTLTDVMLHIVDVERFVPDLMGYTYAKEPIDPYNVKRIIVEVKNEKIQLKDVFQAKNYGELFEADFALLISTDSLPETIRRFLEKKVGLTSYWAYKTVRIARFDTSTEKIDEDSWYRENPFAS